MRTVEITSGAYGLRTPGARAVKAVAGADGGVGLPDAEAARVVALGVARYAGADGADAGAGGAGGKDTGPKKAAPRKTEPKKAEPKKAAPKKSGADAGAGAGGPAA